MNYSILADEIAELRGGSDYDTCPMFQNFDRV